jgi:hypothetical protein
MSKRNDNDPAQGRAAIEEETQESRHHHNAVTGDGPGRELTAEHREFLVGQAIDLDRVNGQVRSVITAKELPADADRWWKDKLPAILFRYSHNGRTVSQLAPDDRTDGPKYLFPENSDPPLNCMRDPGGHSPILIVEGTKQHLAAASYAPDEFAVYGMFGCWGWSGRDLTFAKGRPVYVILDADLASNRDVWNAAQALKDHLKAVKAAGAQFAAVPGAGSTGLDDWLATIERDDRADALAQILDSASPDLPKAPAKKAKTSRYFHRCGRIKGYTVAQALNNTLPMA